MRKLRETLLHLFHPRFSNNHRSRLIHPEGFFVLTVILCLMVGLSQYAVKTLFSDGWVLGYASSISAQQVVDETNLVRSEHELGQLKYSKILSQAAEEKALDMFDDQYWAHNSPFGKTPWDFIKDADYSYSVAGENLARDFSNTKDMIRAWMNSPTHKENLINPKYSEIGVAVVNGKLNGVETTLVVQMFARPLAQGVAVGEPSVPSIAIADQNFQNNSIFGINQTSQLEESVREFATTSKVDGVELSPLALTKALALAVIFLVLSILIYDSLIAHQRQLVRVVGKNLAHISLFMTILFLTIVFRSGVIF